MFPSLVVFFVEDGHRHVGFLAFSSPAFLSSLRYIAGGLRHRCFYDCIWPKDESSGFRLDIIKELEEWLKGIFLIPVHFVAEMLFALDLLHDVAVVEAGLVRNLGSAFFYLLPIDVAQPFAAFDLFDVRPTTVRVVVQQSVQQFSHVWVIDALGRDALAHSPLFQLAMIVRVLRRKPCDELVEKRPQREVVTGKPIGHLADHLRRHVLNAAAVCVGDIVLHKLALAKTKVRNPEVPVDVHEDVLWLHIAVQNAIAVQILEPQKCFAEVGLDIGLFHAVSFEMTEQLATRIEVQQEVQVVQRFERTVEADGVAIVPQLRQDLFLA